MKSNIVMIGMPGAGKSTAGVILAKVMGYSFVDADLVIQEREKRLLKDIIATEGVDGFLRVENDVLKSLNPENTVIATGGSAVYGSEAMEHLKEIGTVVYLKLPFDVINKRLGDIKGRGVVLKEGQTLYDLYVERTVLYEKYADLVIDESNKSIEETVEEIAKNIH